MKQSYVFSVVIALMLFSIPNTAQIRINPKVGVNSSALDTRLGDIMTEARAGWNAGLDFRIGHGLLYLNPGLHYYSYTAKLIKQPELPEGALLKDETRINSIKIPLNIGLNLTGEGGLLGIHAKGGITSTFVTSITEKPSFQLDKDDLNALTWGLNVGIGVDVLFLTADITYETGMTDFFKDSEGKNNVLSFSVGLVF